jgi:fluoride ion exporter CrcB/FEX
MVETVDLVRDKQPGIAALYLVGSLLGGLAAVWIGMTGARLAVRAERWLQEEMQ